MSLKSRLEELIKEKGYVSYDEVERWCHIWGYKVETATRRLRHSESPGIKPIYNERTMFNNKHYVIGYKYEKETNSLSSKNFCNA